MESHNYLVLATLFHATALTGYVVSRYDSTFTIDNVEDDTGPLFHNCIVTAIRELYACHTTCLRQASVRPESRSATATIANA
jgi:hypothetical protein